MMSRKKHPKEKKYSRTVQTGLREPDGPVGTGEPKKLEIVLKCDSMGSLEAVTGAIFDPKHAQAGIEIIHSDVGAVAKSDLQMALTGSRLVVGFNVDVIPKIKQTCQEQEIEVRLYDVIYQLVKDLTEIAGNFIPPETEEEITGEAKVIALFKSSRRGIILGCEVLKGTLARGKDFRVISAMGPIYSGKIESLHIEKDPVNEARPGQQVGLKISNFKDVKLSDLIECFKIAKPDTRKVWHPRGGVFRYD